MCDMCPEEDNGKLGAVTITAVLLMLSACERCVQSSSCPMSHAHGSEV